MMSHLPAHQDHRERQGVFLPPPCDGNKVREKALLNLGSEFAVGRQHWLREYRALGELLGVDFETAIKEHLFGLCHKANTFFDGAAAKRGHSKERLSDCPLLDPVLDSGGFVGIVDENTTPCAVVEGLGDDTDCLAAPVAAV